jgi:hypothetical protein
MLTPNKRGPLVIQSIAEVALVVEEADQRFQHEGARIEFCIASGVNYEGATKYMPILKTLEKENQTKAWEHLLLFPINKNRQARLEKYGNQIRVRISGMAEGAFNRLVNAGKCPICANAEHHLSRCPLVPKEFRSLLEDA